MIADPDGGRRFGGDQSRVRQGGERARDLREGSLELLYIRRSKDLSLPSSTCARSFASGTLGPRRLFVEIRPEAAARSTPTSFVMPLVLAQARAEERRDRRDTNRREEPDMAIEEQRRRAE